MALRLPGLCAIAAASLLSLAGCGGRGADSGTARVVTITERDFSIRAPRTLRAGRVHLVVRNSGPVSHELIFVHASPGKLPLRSDGLTLDEEALDSSIVGVLEPAGPGSRRGLDVRLTPGRYVVFCNMAGHYLAGMSTSITVT